ncbi:MAG TPA: cation diffusion facilitator family transporter [Steroidobacteraceae bacterium]|nr:cation diffusion facilitator family transporter [Steroidobacteraceae bacterium]
MSKPHSHHHSHPTDDAERRRGHARHSHEPHPHADAAHGHSHGTHAHSGPAHGHSHDLSGKSRRQLLVALALTSFILVFEAVASFVTGSLALLSDAAHMATDAAALGIALLAVQLGARKADERRSYGYRRLEIVAAAVNAGTLFIVGGYILWEAVGRFRNPEPIATLGVIAVAAVGLVVNGVAMYILHGGREHSLNVRGAYLEVWADFIGSLGVLIGAALIRWTGALWIDPLIAILIALWVLPRGWALLKSALHVLLEGTPEGIDYRAVSASMLAVPGVCAIHDLHIWSLTSGMPLLTAHVEIDEVAEWSGTLKALREMLARDHRIEHVTIQIERDGQSCGGTHCAGGDC